MWLEIPSITMLFWTCQTVLSEGIYLVENEMMVQSDLIILVTLIFTSTMEQGLKKSGTFYIYLKSVQVPNMTFKLVLKIVKIPSYHSRLSPWCRVLRAASVFISWWQMEAAMRRKVVLAASTLFAIFLSRSATIASLWYRKLLSNLHTSVKKYKICKMDLTLKHHRTANVTACAALYSV